jgi:hypothetical protein
MSKTSKKGLWLFLFINYTFFAFLEVGGVCKFFVYYFVHAARDCFGVAYEFFL